VLAKLQPSALLAVGQALLPYEGKHSASDAAEYPK
jgi:hypothetical protein